MPKSVYEVFGKTFEGIVLEDDEDFEEVLAESEPWKHDIALNTTVFKHVETSTFWSTCYFSSYDNGIEDLNNVFNQVWPREVVKTIYLYTEPK
jgi:hypothetical protein